MVQGAAAGRKAQVMAVNGLDRGCKGVAVDRNCRTGQWQGTERTEVEAEVIVSIAEKQLIHDPIV